MIIIMAIASGFAHQLAARESCAPARYAISKKLLEPRRAIDSSTSSTRKCRGGEAAISAIFSPLDTHEQAHAATRPFRDAAIFSLIISFCRGHA